MRLKFKKGRHRSFPIFFKVFPILGKVLEFQITFHNNCWHENLPSPCLNDLNKILYKGSPNPHKYGASFRYHCWDNELWVWAGLHWEGIQCTERLETHAKKMYLVTPGEAVHGILDLRKGIRWTILGAEEPFVRPEVMKWYQRFVCGMWFGGGPISDHCVAPHDMDIDLKIKLGKLFGKEIWI